ncbi:MAG: DUF3570 domain-containing protein [Myxococcota bacterium]
MTHLVDDRGQGRQGAGASAGLPGASAPTRGSVALRALTGGALALPGMAAPAAADSPIEKPQGVYSYARYFEDGAPSGKVAVGDEDRYEIDVHQIHMASPVGVDKDVALDLVVETMSGASPWAIVPDDEGDLELLMSEASIEDTRVDALLSGNFYNPNGVSTLSAGVSIEDDYRSLNVGASVQRSFQSKHTTVSAGAGVSIDEIDPVEEHDSFTFDNQFFIDRDKDYKQGYTANVGISRVINRNAIIQSNVTYKHSRGYLDDPYKLVFFDDISSFRADRRPGSRHQMSWLTRFRRHSPRFYGTLHLDYRFYVDSWDVQSHTAEVSWFQDIFDWAQLVPSFRYYTQTEADFYKPYYQSLPSVEHYSSDYRLSNYGALAFRAKLVSRSFEIGRVRMEGNFGYEHYMADSDYALSSSDYQDNPGLVTYNLISFALTGRF